LIAFDFDLKLAAYPMFGRYYTSDVQIENILRNEKLERSSKHRSNIKKQINHNQLTTAM
jgi:hypothetical protein